MFQTFEMYLVIMNSFDVREMKFICQFFEQISVEVFGARTQEIFDDVFSKMVAAAQPIPGFRRVKGGNLSYDRLLSIRLEIMLCKILLSSCPSLI